MYTCSYILQHKVTALGKTWAKTAIQLSKLKYKCQLFTLSLRLRLHRDRVKSRPLLLSTTHTWNSVIKKIKPPFFLKSKNLYHLTRETLPQISWKLFVLTARTIRYLCNVRSTDTFRPIVHHSTMCSTQPANDFTARKENLPLWHICVHGAAWRSLFSSQGQGTDRSSATPHTPTNITTKI